MVRLEVEGACRLLSSPSADGLDRCARVLESACSGLIYYGPRASGVRGSPEAIAEASRLQAAVRSASLLLRIGQDYYAEWIHAWGAFPSGYTPGRAVTNAGHGGLMSFTG
jgi:hypothetical protein